MARQPRDILIVSIEVIESAGGRGDQIDHIRRSIASRDQFAPASSVTTVLRARDPVTGGLIQSLRREGMGGQLTRSLWAARVVEPRGAAVQRAHHTAKFDAYAIQSGSVG
jgi:hypothetical protein